MKKNRFEKFILLKLYENNFYSQYQCIDCIGNFFYREHLGFCQFQHESESVCYFHFAERHKEESYENCAECKKFWGAEFDIKLKAKINIPTHVEPLDQFDAAMARIFNC